MAFAGVMTSMPTLPASAEVIHGEIVVAQRQHSALRTSAALPKIVRSSYTITYFSMVQSPVPPGTDISDGFGYRVPPCAGCSSFHEGVDFLPGFGTPVLAIADGVVTEVGNPSGALGVHVTIQHTIDGQTVWSTYGHLAFGSMHLTVGESITRGEVIGKVGDTGQSTGPHLHFQIRLANGKAVNPVPWLAQHVNA
jgi:murein DD-endopeptidase MepM/ murein hydrolase activator NlpD